MIEITMKIEGMMCGMCEAHINDTVRKHFPVKKVTSSHRKGETTIVSEKDISDEALKKAMTETGYRVICCSRRPYTAKGFINRFRR